MTIAIGDMVKFKEVKNASGYPLCGRVIDCDDDYCIVKAYGVNGPGSVDEINDVPKTELEKIDS